MSWIAFVMCVESVLAFSGSWLVVRYRHFGTTYPWYLQGWRTALPLMIEPVIYSETSVSSTIKLCCIKSWKSEELNLKICDQRKSVFFGLKFSLYCPFFCTCHEGIFEMRGSFCEEEFLSEGMVIQYVGSAEILRRDRSRCVR